jgi:hypothetical protein
MKSQGLPVTAPPPSHGLHDAHGSRPGTLDAFKGAAW